MKPKKWAQERKIAKLEYRQNTVFKFGDYIGTIPVSPKICRFNK